MLGPDDWAENILQVGVSDIQKGSRFCSILPHLSLIRSCILLVDYFFSMISRPCNVKLVIVSSISLLSPRKS